MWREEHFKATVIKSNKGASTLPSHVINISVGHSYPFLITCKNKGILNWEVPSKI